MSPIMPTTHAPTPAPLTVWCLYQSSHARGYVQRDRIRVFDTEEEAEEAAELFRKVEDGKHFAVRSWYWVAPAQCQARLWLLMYQECYEGAIVLGVFSRRADAEAAKVSTALNPYGAIGGLVDAEDLFIEEDLLL